jgi:hypothetical protein
MMCINSGIHMRFALVLHIRLLAAHLCGRLQYSPLWTCNYLALLGDSGPTTIPPATFRSFLICPVLYMSKWFSSFERNACLSKFCVLIVASGMLLERMRAMPVVKSEGGLAGPCGVNARDKTRLLTGEDAAVDNSEDKYPGLW